MRRHVRRKHPGASRPGLRDAPEIHARGFAADPSVFDPVLPLVEEALGRAGQEGIGDALQLQQIVRRTVGRWVSDTHRRRSMNLPVVEV